MSIDFVRFVQHLRSPVMDKVMSVITMGGEELAFIVVGIVLFWCCDKKFALYYLINFFLAAIAVNLIKNAVQLPRPYEVDPTVGVGALTDGFSFPSGHTQSAASMAAAIGIEYGCRRKNWKMIVGMVCWVVLVGFSRIYLGQHYLTDVLAGAAIGIVVSVAVYYLLKQIKGWEDIVFTAIVPVMVVLMIIFRTDYIRHRIYFIAGGGAIAVAIGYFIEKRYINYDGRQELWYIQFAKIAIGGVVALMIKEGLKIPLTAWGLNPFAADFIRYFVLGLWVSVGAMASFKYGLGVFKNKARAKDSIG